MVPNDRPRGILNNDGYPASESLLRNITLDRALLLIFKLMFILLHLTGLLLTCTIYKMFPGDAATKVLASMSPLFFLNLSAFFYLPLIETTRIHISSLEEDLAYVKERRLV